MLGLSLLAALIFSAFSGASASASTPVVENTTGLWPVRLTGSGGAMSLHTSAGRTVQCTASSLGIEWSSSTRWKVIPKLTGCTDPKFGAEKCTSAGAAPGEIAVSPMSADLRYIPIGGSQKAGFVFTPETGETVAEFNCGVWVKMTVKGSAIAEITPTNTVTNSFALTFRQSGGEQVPSTYLAPVGCAPLAATLTASGTGVEAFGAEQSALEGTDTVTASKLLKVSANSCA